MKESFVNGDRAIVAHDQTAKVAQPRKGALHLPATSVATQGATVLGARFAAIPAMWGNQFDAAGRQLCLQRITIESAIGNDTPHFLPRPSAMVPPAHADRGERFLREPDLIGRRRVKLLSQRNTLAVDHHRPLRALAPLGFSDFRAPFFAGAKLPSRNDSLQSSCSRWFNSARNTRQMESQTPCSSQSRSRRQHGKLVGQILPASAAP